MRYYKYYWALAETMLVTNKFAKKILIITHYWEKITAGPNLHNKRGLQGLQSDPHDLRITILTYGRLIQYNQIYVTCKYRN